MPQLVVNKKIEALNEYIYKQKIKPKVKRHDT